MLAHDADVVVDVHKGPACFDPLVHRVAITNFLMPRLTGREIAEAIRGAGFTTPIVLIGGSAEELDERRAAETGLVTSVC